MVNVMPAAAPAETPELLPPAYLIKEHDIGRSLLLSLSPSSFYPHKLTVNVSCLSHISWRSIPSRVEAPDCDGVLCTHHQVLQLDRELSGSGFLCGTLPSISGCV